MKPRHSEAIDDQREGANAARRIGGLVALSLGAAGLVAGSYTATKAWQDHAPKVIEEPSNAASDTYTPKPVESPIIVNPSEVPTLELPNEEELITAALDRYPIKEVPDGRPVRIVIGEGESATELPMGFFEGTDSGERVRDASGALRPVYKTEPPRDMSAYIWDKKEQVLGVSASELQVAATDTDGDGLVDSAVVQYVADQARGQMEIYGHASSDPSIVYAFQGLRYLEVGTRVVIENDQGAVLTYRVSAGEDTTKNNNEAIANSKLAENTPGAVLLVACKENPEAGKSTEFTALSLVLESTALK